MMNLPLDHPPITLPTLDDIADEELDSIINDFATEALVPGISLTIHRHATYTASAATVFRSYGIAYGEEPVTPEVRFPISSMTKHIVSLALLRLLGDNGLSEYTLVRDVLPRFRLSSEPVGQGTITFAHILSHSTGVNTYTNVWDEISATGMTFYDYLAKLPSFAEPGGQFSYANIMYDVCVFAIETLSNMNVESYLRQVFFDPLGMESTSYSGEGRKDAAEGHMRRDGSGSPTLHVLPFGAKYGFQSATSSVAWRGGCALISCARDMAKWIAYLPTDPFYSLITKPFILAPDPARTGISIIDGGEHYGFGFFVGSYRSIPYAEHWAAAAGFSGIITHLPTLGLSIVSMTNSWEGQELCSLIVATIIDKVSAKDVIARLHDERKERVRSEEADFEPVQGFEPSGMTNIIGSYVGAGMGMLIFTSASNVALRPQCEFIPWIPWNHGDIRPIIAYLGHGKYAGCLEYRQWKRDSKETESVVYGYPFRLEKRNDGSFSDRKGRVLRPILVLLHSKENGNNGA